MEKPRPPGLQAGQGSDGTGTNSSREPVSRNVVGVTGWVSTSLGGRCCGNPKLNPKSAMWVVDIKTRQNKITDVGFVRRDFHSKRLLQEGRTMEGRSLSGLGE